MRRFAALLLAALLLLPAGCGEKSTEGLLLYYPATRVDSGSALVGQPYAGDPDPDPETLLRALLSGPSQEDLTSPFPKGTALQGCTWDPDDPGNLLVTLSEPYSELTDVALTLADYSIVLTLSQLDGVQTVEITAPGLRAGRRSHLKLAKEEAVLGSEELGGRS